MSIGAVQFTTIVQANDWPHAWAAETDFPTGSVVRPSDGNGYLYHAQRGGRSGRKPPRFKTVIGERCRDGSVVWQCVGSSVVQLTTDTSKYTLGHGVDQSETR